MLLGVFVLVILLASLFPVLFVVGLLMGGLRGIHGKQPSQMPPA